MNNKPRYTIRLRLRDKTFVFDNAGPALQALDDARAELFARHAEPDDEIVVLSVEPTEVHCFGC